MSADRSRASRQDIAEAGDASSVCFPPPSMHSGGIAFAPNVTPGTFNDPPRIEYTGTLEDFMLFPPKSDDSSRPRKTHNRKKPENYIPRPPNAFILFRSAFIRSQHVSTGVETNHSTLSKIIGLTWQNLPNEERQIWHRKSKLAEEQHRLRFPQYAFKPLHTKKKGGVKRKVREVGPKDQTRCAKIAELLVQGKKGTDLDEAVKEFDKHHVPQIVTRFEAPITERSFRPAGASVKEEELAPTLKHRTRRASSCVSRRSTSTAPSCPSPLSTEIMSLPMPLQGQGVGQDASFLNVLSFDHFPYDPTKEDHAFDFASFSFNPVIPSTDPLYQFDSQSQGIRPLDNTFIQPSPQSNLIAPHLSVDTSLTDIENWSRCNSPASPSTNSMPTTPAYPGSPPATGFYRPPPVELRPAYALHDKSSYEGMTPYNPYQDIGPMYGGPVPVVESNCSGYVRTQLHVHERHPRHMDLDYSTFMASMIP